MPGMSIAAAHTVAAVMTSLSRILMAQSCQLNTQVCRVHTRSGDTARNSAAIRHVPGHRADILGCHEPAQQTRRWPGASGWTRGLADGSIVPEKRGDTCFRATGASA